MPVLIAIAVKSLIIEDLTLGLLQLMQRRSAAERSWVAHIGLLALVIMAFAPLVLPSWNVETPALFAQTPAVDAPAPTFAPVSKATTPQLGTATAFAVKSAASAPTISAAAAASAV